MLGNNYSATVIECRREVEGSDVFVLGMMLPKESDFKADPGQFVTLEPLHNCSSMPRPFSIVGVDDNIVRILINVVGKNTEAYSKLRIGDKITVTGPKGKPVNISRETKDYILIGGGYGAVGLIFLAEKLISQGKNVKVFLGARSLMQVSGVAFFQKLEIKVEVITELGFLADGQRKGLVTELLKEELVRDNGTSTIIACGPRRMLRAVSTLCFCRGNNCFVSVEEIMACGGRGSCKGCAIFDIEGRVQHICKDGPVFDARRINWESFAPLLDNRPTRKRKLRNNAMRVSINKVVFEHPTMNASGCLGIEALENREFDVSRMGALVTKGVTLKPRVGNPMPRLCETPSGMINSIGLENLGIKKFISSELSRWLTFGKPVFINIAGSTVEEYVELVKLLNGTDIAGYEVNISCPNKKGGIAFGVASIQATKVTKAVRDKTSKIVIVKLTPNVSDIVEIASAVIGAGADAISLVNTFQAMAINPLTGKSKISLGIGGLSGPAIRPIAVRMVYQLYQANLGVPIIGMGGIEDSFSAAEFLMAGANLIAVGTGSFGRPDIFTLIDNGLQYIMKYHGFESIKEMTGSLLIQY